MFFRLWKRIFLTRSVDLKKPRPILLVSPLPPPIGGLATWTRSLLAKGLPNGCAIQLVDTKIWGRRNIFDQASFALNEFLRTGYIFISLFFQLILHRPRLMHLNCSLSSLGIFRDMCCACLATLFRVPIISHYHGNLPDFQGKRFYGLSQIGLYALMHITTINILSNNPSLKMANKITWHSKQAKTVLLPNFIADEIFKLEVNITERHSPRFSALFAGGITKAKGVLEILTVANELPNVDFHLFGKLHNDVIPFFNQAPANVKLHGVVSHPVLLEKMCESDCLLFPSYSEGFPLTVLEAMAIGLPVIATPVGAIPEMIDDNRGGILIPPKETEGLYHAILTFITNPQLKMTMGQYNRKKSFTQYRYTVVIKKLLSIYEEAWSL